MKPGLETWILPIVLTILFIGSILKKPGPAKIDDRLKAWLSKDKNVWLAVWFVLVPTIIWLISISNPKILFGKLLIGLPGFLALTIYKIMQLKGIVKSNAWTVFVIAGICIGLFITYALPEALKSICAFSLAAVLFFSVLYLLKLRKT